MTNSQPGVFAQGTRSHFQLEFVLRKGATIAQVRKALSGFREPAVTFGGANVVIGFGPALWNKLVPGSAPDELKAFKAVQGPDHRAPATQRDIWIWIHGHGHDIVLDVARGATHALEKVAKLVLEVPCFVYRDSRDLLGFIDGTENPPVAEAPPITLFPNSGTIGFTQKWIHDITKFQALSNADQEKVFGRSKLDSKEMDDKRKPPTAHIARTVIEEDGEELEIFRRSVPYGGVDEHGLYFIAFTNEPRRLNLMISRMFGTSGDGLQDKMLEFTRAVTGSFWWIPSLEDLEKARKG